MKATWKHETDVLVNDFLLQMGGEKPVLKLLAMNVSVVFLVNFQQQKVKPSVKLSIYTKIGGH